MVPLIAQLCHCSPWKQFCTRSHAVGAGRDEGLSVVRLTVASEKWDISSDEVETPVNFGQDQDVFEIQVRADASHNAWMDLFLQLELVNEFFIISTAAIDVVILPKDKQMVFCGFRIKPLRFYGLAVHVFLACQLLWSWKLGLDIWILILIFNGLWIGLCDIIVGAIKLMRIYTVLARSRIVLLINF